MQSSKCEGSWARQPGQDGVGASPRDHSGLKRMTGGTTHTSSYVCTRTGNPGGARCACTKDVVVVLLLVLCFHASFDGPSTSWGGRHPV